MKKKLLSVLLSVAMISTLFAGCGTAEAPAAGDAAAEAPAAEEADDAAEAPAEDTGSGQNMADADVDVSKLAGTKITVYTHGGNRVLGEEKKDEDGNTYRDESSAYLTQLAERFTAETGIEVELNVVTNEQEIEPLFKVEDSSVDVFTPPNWSLAQWEAYSEPYCTIAEASEIYGADYTGSMPNNGTDVFSIMPAKAYNQCVVYNEEVIKAAGYDEIPATLEEFNEMCAAIRDMGVTPISMHRVENWPLATVQDFAGYVVGNANVLAECLKEENPFSEDAPFGKTIKIYTQWKADRFFEQEVYTDFGVAMDSVAYGKAAMMLFGSWVVPQIQGRVPEGTDPSIIKFAPAPDFGAGRYVLAAPADNWAISKFSENKDAARAFIEYVSEDAQFLADSGFIANKKGVEPVVPELYKIIDDAVAAGEVTPLFVPATNDNTLHNQEILEEAGLWADYKYVGLLFDSLDVTKPDDWSAYEKQVEEQNRLYNDYRDELGYTWED